MVPTIITCFSPEFENNALGKKTDRLGKTSKKAAYYSGERLEAEFVGTGFRCDSSNARTAKAVAASFINKRV